jgi:lambda repressor-like predicted transcriptional regulator
MVKLKRVVGINGYLKYNIMNLEQEIKSIQAQSKAMQVELNRENQKLRERVKVLELIIIEAINLPKGIEPHSYSDYKNKRQWKEKH